MAEKKLQSQRLKFSVHPLYILLGIVLAAFGELYTFVAYSMVLVLHELGHSWVAEGRGYLLNEINIMPYGAVLSGSFDGVRTRDEIVIAIAGPITNIVLALFFMALWWLAPVTYFFTETFVIASLVNAAFNLIPIYPLDGGRILFAALKGKLDFRKAVKVMRISGLILGSVMLALFVTLAIFSYNLTYGIIGAFVFFSALLRGKEGEYLRIAGVFDGAALMRGIEVRHFAVSEKSSVVDLLKIINSEHLVNITVLTDGGGKLCEISEKQLAELSVKYPPSTKIGDIVVKKKTENR